PDRPADATRQSPIRDFAPIHQFDPPAGTDKKTRKFTEITAAGRNRAILTTRTMVFYQKMLDDRTLSFIFYQHLSKLCQVLADPGMVVVLAQERRQRVLDLVSQRGFIALSALAQSIDVSESTIRRDLDYWHGRGVLQRTHGGAMYV